MLTVERPLKKGEWSIFFIMMFLTSSILIYGQTNYLTEGNALLNKGDFGGAERIFRAGVKAEPDNSTLQSQLALALIQQRKLDEADLLLGKILAKDSMDIQANWYSGISNYKNEKYRKSVASFEKVLPKVDKRSGEFISGHWFIGKAYGELLITEGITSREADRMFECFDTYLKLQPNAQDSQQLREYVILKKKRRPEAIEEVWIDY